MIQSIAHVTYLVQDYDEAIAYFTKALNFDLIEDRAMGNGKRWVTVRPPGSNGTSLLLARASTDEQSAQVGHQAGGRVFLFLQTDDFWRDYDHLLARGVKFAEIPREEAYGIVAVFADLYGNRWDLLQYK